jgi:hypothetical protein
VKRCASTGIFFRGDEGGSGSFLAYFALIPWMPLLDGTSFVKEEEEERQNPVSKKTGYPMYMPNNFFQWREMFFFIK